MKKAKKWISITIDIILWLFVSFAIIITILVLATNKDDNIPSINGKSPISVLTDSMSPTFKAGDLIICDKLTVEEKSKLEINDIITYYVDLDGDGIKEINTHRIVEKYEEPKGYVYYITQGDNRETNLNEDSEPVFYGDVICRYTDTKFSGVGAFLSFLQTSTGFLVVIVLPLIAFFIYELYRFILVLVEFKHKKTGKISSAEEEEIKRRAIEEYLRSQQASTSSPPDDAPTEKAIPADEPADEPNTPEGEQPSEKE